MKKFLFFIFFIFICCCISSAAAEETILGSWSLGGWIKTIGEVTINGIVTSPATQVKKPEWRQDPQGNLWFKEGNILYTEKIIACPEGTIDFQIEKEVIFFYLKNGIFAKRGLDGARLLFQRRSQFGFSTFFSESEKVEDLIDWEVSGGKIYVLNDTFQILTFDVGSGQIERTLFFREGITGIAVEGREIYLSSLNQISCYLLSTEKLQWTWTNWQPIAGGFKKIKVRDGILYAISGDQLFRIKIGKVFQKKEVRQSFVASTSKSTSSLVDFAINDKLVVTLDKEGKIEVYDRDLNPISRYSFQTENARAIAMDGNRLYILGNNHRIHIYEFCEKK
jgi:hypothetical protein